MTTSRISVPTFIESTIAPWFGPAKPAATAPQRPAADATPEVWTKFQTETAQHATDVANYPAKLAHLKYNWGVYIANAALVATITFVALAAIAGSLVGSGLALVFAAAAYAIHKNAVQTLPFVMHAHANRETVLLPVLGQVPRQAVEVVRSTINTGDVPGVVTPQQLGLNPALFAPKPGVAGDKGWERERFNLFGSTLWLNTLPEKPAAAAPAQAAAVAAPTPPEGGSSSSAASASPHPEQQSYQEPVIASPYSSDPFGMPSQGFGISPMPFSLMARSSDPFNPPSPSSSF